MKLFLLNLEFSITNPNSEFSTSDSDAFFPKIQLSEPIGGVIWRGISLVRLWIWRSRSRRHLMTLDSRMLSDVGLSRSEAEGSYNKWFWQE